MPKISVLIPAYNVERFLSKCLESVLSQTFKDFEVILIDDGSSDATRKICDEYANKDSRIKVFHQKNQGISATRNMCLQYASGKYIQFVDSDDWIETEMFQKMYEEAENHQADVVGCDFIRETQKGAVFVDSFYENKEKFVLGCLQNGWAVLWKIMIRKSLVVENGIAFPKEINGGEDFVFVMKTLECASKVVCVRGYFYHYNQLNESSFITNPSYEKLIEQYKATELVSDFFRQKGTYDSRILNYRKVCIKSTMLKIAFFKSYQLYPEVDLCAIWQKISKKRKILFAGSFLLNKIFPRKDLN